MNSDVTSKRLKAASQWARDFLIRDGFDPNKVANKQSTTLCVLLGIRYKNGEKPKWTREKKAALVEWYLTGNKFVEMPEWANKKPQKTKTETNESDVRLLVSASSGAARFVRAKNKKLFDKVNNDKFLNGREWKTIRQLALKTYGNQCMACGITPEFGAMLHVDHIKPRKLYPQLALDIKNLQILCSDCNFGKANWNTEDYRPEKFKNPNKKLEPDDVDFDQKLDRLHKVSVVG